MTGRRPVVALCDNRPAGPMIEPRDVLVVIPVYNDWEAVSLLLVRLDAVLAQADISADVLLVDDGSVEDVPGGTDTGGRRALCRIDVLKLRRNLGHQRAIATGLCYAHDHLQARAVVVMDGDGEDAPEDVPRLIEKLRASGARAVVFAERTRRSENLTFRIGYALYRWAHRLLTGIAVRVGNFSAFPYALLPRLVTVSELWNHYAAAVFKSGLPREAIPTTRGARLHGRPRMNYVALLAHGLSALSVHAELVGVRLLAVTGLLACALVGLMVGVLVVRLATPLAIPGWTSTLAAILLVLLVQAAGFAGFLAFVVLHGRSQPGFIPIRDYVHFVDSLRPLAGGAKEP